MLSFQIVTVEADDVRREKGCYTREKNLLFLKNVIEMGGDANFRLKRDVAERHKIKEVQFGDVFAGPMPVFEETKRVKGFPGFHHTAKRKLEDKSKKNHKRSKSDSGKPSKAQQATLDGWVKGDGKGKKSGGAGAGGEKPVKAKVKKQTAAEVEAEMTRMRQSKEKFKEEMRQRAEEARKKKLEERAREKERKKEEKKLLNQLMGEWKKKRDDLECDDLKELPKPKPVHCKVPNQLFGDFLTLLEFFHRFSDMLTTKDSFPNGVTFDILEEALADEENIKGPYYELLNFMLTTVFDLQDEEDEELKLDKIVPMNVADIDKNILGKDVDIANQIRSATEKFQWPMKTQGVGKLRELHMDEWSLTEILRLHLESGGAFRSDKMILWLYQQRGGYRLTDDPALNFRMEEPQILEVLNTKTVYEVGVSDKIKILNCLMCQILSYATVRDDIEDRFVELTEAKSELRTHMIAVNKRLREKEEAEKAQRREERMQKKEEELKVAENNVGGGKKEDKDSQETTEKKEDDDDDKDKKRRKREVADAAHLTERQRLAIQAQKEKEEKEKQRKEEIKQSAAYEKEHNLSSRVAELQTRASLTFLGRDRAYRRFWTIESLPGLFVEHDDDNVGPCLAEPTPANESSGPMDESAAMEKVRQMMNSQAAASGGKSPDEKASSDKENDQQDERKQLQDVSKTYSKKPPATSTSASSSVLKQKVLSAKNGTLDMTSAAATVVPSPSSASSVPVTAAAATTTMTTTPQQSSSVNENERTPEKKSEMCQMKSEIKLENHVMPWGVCLTDAENCQVHSTILPKTHWAYYGSVEELDELIDTLNPRGIRESDLKDKLTTEHDRLTKSIRRLSKDMLEDRLNGQQAGDNKIKPKVEDDDDDDNKTSSVSYVLDLALRDQILEMEEKIFHGTLGTLKIQSRQFWQQALQRGEYDRQCDTLSWGGKSVHDTPSVSRLQSARGSKEATPEREQQEGGGGNKRDSSGSASTGQDVKKVRDLASAILQISQMVEAKYFQPPLGEDEKEKKKRLKEEERRQKVTI